MQYTPLLINIDATDALRSALEKLVEFNHAPLTRDELCDLAALRLQVTLALWRHSRAGRRSAPPAEIPLAV